MQVNIKNFKKLVSKLKCFFGLHNWYKYIPSERVCECCKKKQRYITTPSYPYPHWNTFVSDAEFKKETCFYVYQDRLEYQDMLGKWYKYQIEFLEYFYPTKLRDKNKI